MHLEKRASATESRTAEMITGTTVKLRSVRFRGREENKRQWNFLSYEIANSFQMQIVLPTGLNRLRVIVLPTGLNYLRVIVLPTGSNYLRKDKANSLVSPWNI